MKNWRAGEGIVVRTPLLPLTLLLEWASAPDPRKFLDDVLALPEVNEALFVASPSLHGNIAAWRAKPAANRRIEHALAKYVARMAGRATPFGLFSGVSVGSLGRETSIELAPRSEYRRRTRLDNDYLFVLANALAHAHRDELPVRPNNSIYRVGGRLRFAAARLDGKERSYHLVAATPTDYLDATLARAANGARLGDLAAALVDDEITAEEARAYIDSLVDAQLLVPELGVYVTGPEPIDGLLAQLGKLPERADVERARASIAALDGKGLGNAPAAYEAIAVGLEALPAKVDRSLLFQVDMAKPARATLGNRVVADLASAIDVVARVGKSSEASSLEDFRSAFRERWEDQEVPLADVLDEESGIGFERARGPGSEGAPLLAKLGFPGGRGEERVAWPPLTQFLLRRLGDALASGATEIALDAKQLATVALPTAARLPDAFGVMIRLEGTPEDLTIFYEGTSGPSGARLLGRFCHLAPEIDAMVRAHHAAEEALRPDAVFAEIVHLNEGRIGNILCRPVLRAYEITYLGTSGAPADRQITLDDLLVSVRGDRIVLRSKKLGREIIPRLTTAHNYRLRSLGVYRFLCALASQGCDHAHWSWGPLGSAPFLPRVKIGRVVVSRATWNLDEADLAGVTAASKGKADVVTEVAALRAKKKLPRFLVIAAGDNELPIDLDNPLLAAAFADEIAGQGVRLVEMFPAPDKLVVRGPEGRFSNELALTFARTGAPQPSLPPRSSSAAPGQQRSFVPGSEWLYAKLYCGESTTDHVLRELAPMIRGRGQWFFIRYSDPDPHVRLRFRGDPAPAIVALERAAAPLLATGAVRKLVLDTYSRELERYRDIELVEQIFWHDSEAVLSIVELLDGDAGGDARWRLALRGIDSLLEAIGLDADARMKICSDARESLGREFNADTAFWSRIGDRFAAERASLDVLFARDPERDRDHDLEPGFEILAKRDAAIAATVGNHRFDADVAWSLVHMHANRLLHASQRAQELVLYDFLRRLHQSRKARAKATPAS